MMEVNNVSDWILDAQKGEKSIYYTGNLADDRERLEPRELKKNISTLANFVWSKMEAGLIYLVQERAGKASDGKTLFNYVMVRSSKDRV
jgi:hypothetical protein